MVKVVPLIVAGYAIQCYFIMKMGSSPEAGAEATVPLEMAVNGLFFLGACLAVMIAGFITYDLTHCVNFSEDSFTISVKWLGHEKTIPYHEVADIQVSDAGQSFATLSLTTVHGIKFRFFFVDEADKLQLWIQNKTKHELKTAA